MKFQIFKLKFEKLVLKNVDAIYYASMKVDNFSWEENELLLILQEAIADVVDAAKDADILIFVLPHQFIKGICSTLLGKIKPTAIALSLIKVILKNAFIWSYYEKYFLGVW